MAFSAGPKGDPFDHLADINVTPLVDVMLVLLIIFMVTAPMLHQGVAVALPKAQASNLPKGAEDPVILSITKSGLYYINETPVAGGLLKDRLQAYMRTRADKTIYLKADRSLPYGTVVETMDLLNRMGIENLGMLTESREKK
ncbi:MAG TPA: protein TolR [Thermoanaerobaculia bacterium]|nr:protein TolR [Thermoanaerobaculia bacterium]